MSRNAIRNKRSHKCPCCNREIKRNLGYYHNGIYYSSRGHYKKYLKKLKQEQIEKEK